MTRPRLYLDVDGTVSAGFAENAWGEQREFRIGAEFAGSFGWSKITFAPALVVALDAIVSEFGVEIVWLTTHSENRDVIRKIVPKLGGLRGGRVLPYVSYEENFHWKRDALLVDLDRVPAPFIWADDSDVPGYRRDVLKATQGLPSLLLAPESNLGLTVRHLNQMRDFLTSLISGSEVEGN